MNTPAIWIKTGQGKTICSPYYTKKNKGIEKYLQHIYKDAMYIDITLWKTKPKETIIRWKTNLLLEKHTSQ